MSNYDFNIVKKPWGYEYLVYETKDIAIWFLYIKHTHSTSLHCHPKKTTGLVLLDGQAEVSFFNNSNKLLPGQKIMIRKGLFHSTKATHEKGAYIFEVETPVDKQDLVRFRDSYGREGKPYEDETHEIPKKDDCLWITDPETNGSNVYNFSNCKLRVHHITSINFLNTIQDNVNIMFLKGGLQTNYGQNVAGPGDVVSSNTLKQMIEIFDTLHPDTTIMILEYNG